MFTLEHVSTQDRLAREQVSMQRTLAREHVRHVGTRARRAHNLADSL